MFCAISQVWQLTLVFSAFHRLFGNNLILYHTHLSNHPPCHVTEVKMSRFFWFIASRHYWSLITPSFRNFSRILFKVESSSWSQFVQNQTFEKNALSLIRNNTQTAVTNMTKNRMLETKLFNLTFRMFRHTSSEVTVYNTSNN